MSNTQSEVLAMFQQAQSGLDAVQNSGVLPPPLGQPGYTQVPVLVTGLDLETVADMKVYNRATNTKNVPTGCAGIQFQFSYAVDPDFLTTHPALESTFKGAPFTMPVDFDAYQTVVAPMEGASSAGPWNPALDKGRNAIRDFKSAASAILGIPGSEITTSSLQEILDLLNDEDSHVAVVLKFTKDGKYTREYMTPSQPSVELD